MGDTFGKLAEQSGADKIVCVYGALRSGTTLLRLMLDAHPQLICPGESDFLFEHLRENPATGELFCDPAAMERDRIFRNSGLALPDRAEISQALPGLIAGLRKGRRGTLVLMTHRHPDRILRLFPRLKIVHMLRDPRDVARSSIGMLWAGNVFFGVDHWSATERAWDCVANQLDPSRVFTLRYEELVARPSTALEALCHFFGDEFDPAMLSYHATSTYQKPDSALIEQWRHNQTPREIGLVEAKIGDLLERRGYAPSGYAPVVPGAFDSAMLAAQSKLSVKHRTIARYGLRDVTMLFVGRLLGISALRHRVQRNIDEKVANYLK
jgi:hypothetical protein